MLKIGGQITKTKWKADMQTRNLGVDFYNPEVQKLLEQNYNSYQNGDVTVNENGEIWYHKPKEEVLVQDKGYSEKGDTIVVENRKEARNIAKDRAGIPRSQQFTRQWTVGNDVTRKGHSNYVYSADYGSHGRFLEYDTPVGKKVIVEHYSDGPSHYHAGELSDPSRTDLKEFRYSKIEGKHHIYYE